MIGERGAAWVAGGVGVGALVAELVVKAGRRGRLRPLLKRWRVGVLVLLLCALYPVSGGAVFYAMGRRWEVGQRFYWLYRPLVRPTVMSGPLGERYGRYLLWWEERGREARWGDRWRRWGR